MEFCDIITNSNGLKMNPCDRKLRKRSNGFLIFTTVLILSMSVTAKPIINDPISGAMLYLSQYGWLDKSNIKADTAALVDIRGAIRDFQAFAGLNVTGDLDEETDKLMATPRCGVKDKIGHGANGRKKRYVLQGSRWKVNTLSYAITKYPTKLHEAEVDAEIESAFKVWEQYANLTFVKAASPKDKVHIEVQFQKAEHGDDDPFDGEGGTLAHSYFPIYGGDAHFDDDERWTINSYRGTNLFYVAAHEFGHSLGLSHSYDRTSLMAPFYWGYQSSFKLAQGDITAIQTLYGRKTRTTPTTTTPATTPKPNEMCKDPKIEAITTMGDKQTYVFQNGNYYKLTQNAIAVGYPRRILDDFGVPGNIDAAFTWTNDKTYFFKGSQYWRLTDMKLDIGYPKNISDGFEGIPSNIDAVFVWSGNGKIYFFKGDEYYRFDPSRRPPISPGYPKLISNWVGIPNNIDAALQYSNGNTYFFKDNKYWRFNDRTFAVDEATPAFPRSSTTWWFGCENPGESEESTGVITMIQYLIPSILDSEFNNVAFGLGLQNKSIFSVVLTILLYNLLVLYML